MSPSWREPRAGAPRARARGARAARAAATGRRSSPATSSRARPAEPGQAVVARRVRALEAALRAFDCRGAEATVILSNAFVRYPGGAVARPDRLGRRTGGVRPARLPARVRRRCPGLGRSRVSDERYGAPAIAAAVDHDLLAAVRGALGPARDRRRLGAAVPHVGLQSLARRARRGRFLPRARRDGRGVPRAGRRRRRGAPSQLRARTAASRRSSVGELVERELCLAGLDPGRVQGLRAGPGARRVRDAQRRPDADARCSASGRGARRRARRRRALRPRREAVNEEP